MLVPKLVTTLRGYTRAQLTADLTAGVIVGIVALPLSIAFAIASGVTPDRGLWTAIVAGFLISALGGSRVQIGGPTGAFVVIVYGIVQQYGVDGLVVATLMAGVILVAMGLFRFGAAIKFIPHPVVVGFTSGIAVIIFSSQVKDFLGLQMGAVPADFIEKWRAFLTHGGGVNPTAVLVGTLALLIIVAWPRVSRRMPGPFVALVVATVLVQWFHLPVETIGSRFGEISAFIPIPAVPALTYAQVVGLIGPAFTIAMLGAVESLLSAVVSDGMIGARHRSNMELVGQGVANIAGAMVGGIPATGAIARTATNVKSGGRTPIAGMTHAVVLLVITLFAGHWAAYIPMAALAALLVVVAYNMSEWRVFVGEFRGPRSDIAVLLATFLLTVLVDLTVAIGVGMVLASFLFMKRMAEVSDVTAIRAEAMDADDDAAGLARMPLAPRDVQVYAINGPFFFGAADRFKDTLRQVADRPKVLILRLGGVPVIDSTGLNALRDVIRRSRREGTRVMLTEVQPAVRRVLDRAGLDGMLHAEDITPTLEVALGQVRGGPRAPATTGEHPARRVSDRMRQR
ncbi:MAG: SulP family inorganic anion transporter [Gemmatimonadota bacterium]|nr:SulP family inorganic anion transporter [Gemmatimonadota bacterium]